jgi:hypothetical protein
VTERDPELNQQELRSVEAKLADYVASTDEAPSPGFTDWVMRSIEGEPVPRRGLAATLAFWFSQPGPMRRVAQAVVVVAIVAAGIGSAIAIGNLGGVLPQPGSSPSPLPSVEATPIPTAIPSPTTQPSPSPTANPTPIPTESPDDTDEPETPEPEETPDST